MNCYFVIVSVKDDLLFELDSFKPDYYTTVPTTTCIQY
jgi:hypothetical protein